MFKVALAVSCAGLAHASTLGATVSTQGQHVELSREQQLAEWQDLKDEKYNSKGFMKWKPQKDGFILLNMDSNLINCKVKSTNHDSENAAVNVGFDCNVEGGSMPVSPASFAETAASARSRFASKFTPIQKSNKLDPIDIEEAYANYMNRGASSRGHDFNVFDDSNNEGEPDNSITDPSVPSEAEDHKEQLYMNQMDMGYSPKLARPAHDVEEPYKHLGDVPYVDAGVDREVNNEMFEFFKKHPQYHTPQAHWRSANKWKSILTGGETGETSGDPGMFHNTCGGQSKVPSGWPDVPTLKCKHYAISPMGYWGCKWLFEDGTCGYIQYYPSIRWDGLDAYPTNHHDMPQDQDLIDNGAFPGPHVSNGARAGPSHTH